MNTANSTPRAPLTDAEEIPAGAHRCSDAERERTSAHLQAAVGEGRLSMDEVEDRLARTYAARYRHELDAITADLPRNATTTAGWGAVLALAGRQLHDDLAALAGRATAPAGRRRTVVLTLAALTIVLFVLMTIVLALHGILGDGPGHHGFPRD